MDRVDAYTFSTGDDRITDDDETSTGFWGLDLTGDINPVSMPPDTDEPKPEAM